MRQSHNLDGMILTATPSEAAPLDYSITECLMGYTGGALGQMCEIWRLEGEGRAERVRVIGSALEDPERLALMFHHFTPDHLRLLHLISAWPGARMADVLAAPALYTLGDPVEALRQVMLPGAVLACPSNGLGAFAFSHLSREEARKCGATVLVTPRTVQDMLAGLPPPLPLTCGAVGESTPVPAPQSTCPHLVTAFLEVLRLAETVPIRVTANGSLHRMDLSRAQQQAHEAGVANETVELCLMIARRLGCIHSSHGRLATAHEADAWVRLPSAERLKRLYIAFLSSDDLTDLRWFFPQMMDSLTEHLPPHTLRRAYHRALPAAMLRSLRPGDWNGIGAFIGELRRLDENVLFLDESWRAVLAHARGDIRVWKDGVWRSHEARYYDWFIRTFLHGLGFVEMSQDGLVFRLTPMGHYATGDGPLPDEPFNDADGAIVIQPDFEVIAYLDKCPPELHRKLDSFCHRVRAGIVSTYKLTQDSIHRGVRTGKSLSAFVEMLSQYSKRVIPANVANQFTTWERKLTSIVVYPSCELLEFATEQEAQDALEIHCGRLLGGRFLLADPPMDDAVMTLDYQHPVRPCLEQEPGLVLRAPAQSVDLLLRRRLREVGVLEEQPNGDILVRLAPPTRGAVMDFGLAIAQLECLAQRPLAARYRIALRAWNGGAVHGASATATLIRFEDAETCDAILEMPSLAEHVEGRLGLRTLAIRAGALMAFKKELRVIGVTLAATQEAFDDGPPSAWLPQPPMVENRPSVTKEDEPPPQSSPHKRGNNGGNGHLHEAAPVALPSYSPRIVRELLEDAIAGRRTVLIAYQPTYGNGPAIRRVNPVHLDLGGAAPVLSAFCHLHQGPRVFKLSQIRGIRILEDEVF